MNKRGELMDNIAINYVIYILIVVILVIFLFFNVMAFQDKAAVWEDFYVKEIVRIIDTAEPGQEVYLDVTLATTIAFKNEKGKSEIFNFDNEGNSVTVSLTRFGSTRFSYFNDVDIVDWRLEVPSRGAGAEVNRLYFRIVEVQRDDREN